MCVYEYPDLYEHVDLSKVALQVLQSWYLPAEVYPACLQSADLHQHAHPGDHLGTGQNREEEVKTIPGTQQKSSWKMALWDLG